MPDEIDLTAGFIDPSPRRALRLRPELESHWNALQSELKNAGERPVLRSGFRTAAQQNALHRAGKPTKGNDGYVNISPHQEGRAIDIGNLSNRGRRVVADYARRQGLHVPSDEPWHIAIPKSRTQQPQADLSAGLDPPSSIDLSAGFTDQGQTPPPQEQVNAVPATTPPRRSVPAITGRFGTPHDRRYRKPLRPSSRFAEVEASVSGVQQPAPLSRAVTALPGVHQLINLFPEEERENFAEGVTGAIAGTARQLANTQELGMKATPYGYLGRKLLNQVGIEPRRMPEVIREAGQSLEQAVAENVEQRPAPTTFTGQVRRGVGRGAGAASVELPKLIAGGRLLGAANLPVQGALSRADEGIPGVIKGAAGGLVYHYGGQLTGKMLGQVGNSLVWIAGPTAERMITDPNADLGETIGENVPFGIFAGAGGARRRPRPTRQTVPEATQEKLRNTEQVQVRDGETVRPATQEDLPRIVNREIEVVPPAVEAAERSQVRREFERIREQEGVEDAKAAEIQQMEQSQPRGETSKATGDVRQREMGDRGSNVRSVSEPPVAPSIAVGDERGISGSEPQRFQHLQFGELTASENQRSVPRGSIRVVDGENVEHVIQKPKMTGAGNQRAIPIKETPAPESLAQKGEPPIETALATQGAKTQPESIPSVIEGVGRPASSVQPRPSVAEVSKFVLHPLESVMAQFSFGKEQPLDTKAGVYKTETATGKEYSFDLHTLKLADGRERLLLVSGDPKVMVDAGAVVRPVEGGVVIETIHGGVTGFPGLGGVLARQIAKRYGKIIPEPNAPLSPAGRRATDKLAGRQSRGGGAGGTVLAKDATTTGTQVELNNRTYTRQPDGTWTREDGQRVRGIVEGKLNEKVAEQESVTTRSPRPSEGIGMRRETPELINAVPQGTQMLLKFSRKEGTVADADLKALFPEYDVTVERKYNALTPEFQGVTLTFWNKGGTRQVKAPADAVRRFGLAKTFYYGQEPELNSVEGKLAASGGSYPRPQVPPTRQVETRRPFSGTAQPIISESSTRVEQSSSGKAAATQTPMTPRPEPSIVTSARERKAKRASDKAEGIEYRRSGADPVELIDNITIKGWELYSEKVKPTFDEWSKRVREEFGERANPHLRAVWKGLGGESELPPSTTTAKREKVTADRAERGLPPIPKPERKADADLLDSAKAANASDPTRPLRLAEEVLNYPRALSDKETVQLDLRKQELNNDYERNLREIAEASDPEVIHRKFAESDAIEVERQRIEEAWARSGTEKGRSLRAQRITVDEKFRLLPMVGEFTKAKGRKLTTEERSEVEQIKSERDKALEERDIALEQARGRELDRYIVKERRARRQAGSRETLDAEAAVIRESITAELARLRSRSTQASGLAGIDPEGVLTKNLLKYARNRVQAHVGLKAEALIDEIHDLVKDVASRRQVAELLAGRMSARRERSEAVKQLAEIRREIDSALNMEDVAAGRRSPKQEGPQPHYQRNQRRLTQLREKEAELSARLKRPVAESDFVRPKRPAYEFTREVKKAEDRVIQLENQWSRKLEKERAGHWVRNVSGIWKSWLLSSPATQAMNIAGTGSYQAFREVARIPAAIMDGAVSVATGRRGITAPSPSAMLDSVVQAVTVGGREARDILKHGAPREITERHQYHEIDTGVKAIDVVHNAIFRFMSASDRVFYQGAYKRNLIDRATVQAKNERASNVRQRVKELTETPSKELEADARHDALVSTFNNNNALSEKIKRARSTVINPRSTLSRRGAERLNAVENLAIDLVMPFDRTPTNVIMRIVEASPAGYGKNALQLIGAAMRKSMPVEHQRQFSQTFGNATTGTALMGLGWYLGDKARGIIEIEDNGDVFLKIPGLPRLNLRTASPAGNILATGARLRAVHDDPKSTMGDYVKPILKEPLNQPLLRSTNMISEFARDPARSGEKVAARYAASAIPFSGAVRFAAQNTDPEARRYPQTFSDRIKQNVPLLRQSVPVSSSPVFRNFISSTEATKELKRLGMTVRGVKISPDETPEDYEVRKQRAGSMIVRDIDRLVTSNSYKRLSDNEKRKQIHGIVDSASQSHPPHRSLRRSRATTTVQPSQ